MAAAEAELPDLSSLTVKLQGERAEKEKFRETLSLKEKTIKVMRTELDNTYQEKLKLENSIKSLQMQVDKLAHQLNTRTDSDDLHDDSTGNVRENIRSFEERTARSGSDPPSYVSSYLKIRIKRRKK